MPRLRALGLFLPGLILAGCFGRPSSELSHANLTCSALGLQAGRPALVSFSALWCHPCREEIESLNKGNQEFSGQVQVAGFLVEGEEKGSPVESADLNQFTSFSGERPSYVVQADSDWRLFDKLGAPFGRALPTLAVLDSNCQVQQIVQQSLDYDTQLRPLLASLAQGGTPPTVDPVPTPPPSSGQELTDTVQNWLARTEVSSQASLGVNLTAAWTQALQRYAFTTDEMPLMAGKITFTWDGADKDIPEAARWKADTAVSVCRLQLNLKPDGSFLSATGSCQPK